MVKEIIKNIIKNKNFIENSKEKVSFNIFDDMVDYFPKVREFENKYDTNIQLTLIDNKISWNSLL